MLSQRSRDKLTLWMEASLSGLERLRAKLPASWRVADKTGANGEHTSNDIAVIWPAGKPPIIVAAYITQCNCPLQSRTRSFRRRQQRPYPGRFWVSRQPDLQT